MNKQVPLHESIAKIIDDNGLDPYLKDYLPSPDLVQEIIRLANESKVDKARNIFNEMQSLFSLLEGRLDQQEKNWFSSVLEMLDSALSSL